jgi:hypothetical protein
MAQHKQLTWTELRVGLFVLAGAVLLAVVIFYVTGGSGFGPKYRLRAFLPEVDGLTVGAPVRVDGVDVGNVEKIVIAVPKPGVPVSKDRNIEVDLRLDKNYQTYIRTDSSAGLITEGLLGNRYVDIDRGYVGRAYSQARQLRERYGFRGELRATGDVLRDQFLFLLRAGFDAFEVKKAADAPAFAASIGRYSVFYQPSADGRPSALRRRQIREAAPPHKIARELVP